MSSLVASDADQRARVHWRRQLLLTGLAAVVVLAALGVLALTAASGRGAPLSELRLAPDGRVEIARPAEDVFRTMLWPALAALLAMTVVLGAVVVHTIRVASFTFRRGA